MESRYAQGSFRALQATIILLGVVALRGVWFGLSDVVTATAAYLCARFPTITIQVDVCGAQAGAMGEQSYTNPPNVGTFWFGEVPCGGSDLSFLRLAYDGLTSGYQANFLSAVASSGQGHLTAVWKAWKIPPVGE
jgi:hypothetical protein